MGIVVSEESILGGGGGGGGLDHEQSPICVPGGRGRIFLFVKCLVWP